MFQTPSLLRINSPKNPTCPLHSGTLLVLSVPIPYSPSQSNYPTCPLCPYFKSLSEVLLDLSVPTTSLSFPLRYLRGSNIYLPSPFQYPTCSLRCNTPLVFSVPISHFAFSVAIPYLPSTSAPNPCSASPDLLTCPTTGAPYLSPAFHRETKRRRLRTVC